MIGIIKWVKERLADTVENIYCIHCREHRTVYNRGVEMVENSKRRSKRMLGQCTTCEGQTSTFVVH